MSDERSARACPATTSAAASDERTRRTAIKRSVIHEASLPCDIPLNELDMDWLRRQFSTLFDRAAQATFLQGYDLDEVIVERFFCVVSKAQETVTLLVPSLHDKSLIDRACGPGVAQSRTGASPSPRITQLQVVVTLERW